MRTLFPYRKHCHASWSKRPAVASVDPAGAGRRWLVAILLWLLMLPSLLAQVESLWLSPDVTTELPLSDGSTFPIADSVLAAFTFPGGEIFEGTDLLAGDGFFSPVAVDGIDSSLLAFSIDIDAEVTPVSATSSVFMRAGEIRATDGELVFDPVTAGLAGSGLVLRNNGGDDLAISGNGSFTFATPVPDGDMYRVTVASQPSGPVQSCSVSNGSGTVSGANVTNVQVTCVTGGEVQVATSVAEAIENEGPVTSTVNRVGGSHGATSFRVETASGSATPGTPTSATVTIFDNETVLFADGFEASRD